MRGMRKHSVNPREVGFPIQRPVLPSPNKPKLKLLMATFKLQDEANDANGKARTTSLIGETRSVDELMEQENQEEQKRISIEMM